jgi:predicted DNA-binding ribbon-helix-helix protein
MVCKEKFVAVRLELVTYQNIQTIAIREGTTISQYIRKVLAEQSARDVVCPPIK